MLRTYVIYLLGAPGVGKTSFLRALIGDKFVEQEHKPAGFNIYTVQLGQTQFAEEPVVLEIHDFAGDFDFFRGEHGGTRDQWYPEANGSLCFYNSVDSNHTAVRLKQLMRRKTGRATHILVANKDELTPNELVNEVFVCPCNTDERVPEVIDVLVRRVVRADNFETALANRAVDIFTTQGM